MLKQKIQLPASKQVYYPFWAKLTSGVVFLTLLLFYIATVTSASLTAKPIIEDAHIGSPIIGTSTLQEQSAIYAIIPTTYASGDSTILAVVPETGHTFFSLKAQYRPMLVLSPERDILYVVDTVYEASGLERIRAFDSLTGQLLWQLNLPGTRDPFMFSGSGGLWTSIDGAFVYVLMGEAGNNPRIVTVDAAKQEVIHEIKITLPYPSQMYWPRFWKPNWTEELIIVSNDELFTIDLSLGQRTRTINLPHFDLEAQLRIPKNLNQIVTVEGGDIAEESRQLYLVTNAQDVIVVDFNDSLNARRVFALPSGWQFNQETPIVTSSTERKVYFSVRQNGSPLEHSRLSEEVWSYETVGWHQVGSISSPAGFMSIDIRGNQLYTFAPQSLDICMIYVQDMDAANCNSWVQAVADIEVAPLVYIFTP